MGLYVQREALLISQKALDITGNNISNINTPGYTRQRVDICSVANAKGNLGYNTAVSLAGQGSEAVGVAQIRDRLLDRKVRVYSSDLCDVGVKTSTLSDVEDVFDSIEADELEASFAAIVNKFKEALQSFSADNADRRELATISKNTAQSVVQCINNYNLKLDDISEQVLSDTEKTLKRINSIFSEMGSLNRQIKDSYVSMKYYDSTTGNYQVMNDYGPLELKDEMHSLLDELSQYGNIYVTEEADGTFSVDFAGQAVVRDKDYAQMALANDPTDPLNMGFIVSKSGTAPDFTGLMDKDEWYNIKLAAGGSSDEYVRANGVDITGKNDKGEYFLDTGSLRGYLDVYNGQGIFFDSLGSAGVCLTKGNDALEQMAALNKQIASGTAGADAADKLAELAKELKENIGAEITVNADGTYTAKVNGSEILNADKYAQLAVKADGKAVMVSDLYNSADWGTNLTGSNVTDFVNANSAAEIAAADVSGNAGGFIQTAQKAYSNSYCGIEYYRDMLNSFVKTMTDEFNSIFEEFGYELFTYKNDDGVADFRDAASNFRIADDWLKNPEIISNPTGSNEYEELNNIYINKMLGVFTTAQSYGNGAVTDPQKFSLEKFVGHICEELGTNLETEKGVYDATDIMLTSVETARSEVMDVSMGEEGINMMNYQKWYNAISRMVTTLDEALDKLINGTGRVGL